MKTIVREQIFTNHKKFLKNNFNSRWKITNRVEQIFLYHGKISQFLTCSSMRYKCIGYKLRTTNIWCPTSVDFVDKYSSFYLLRNPELCLPKTFLAIICPIQIKNNIWTFTFSGYLGDYCYWFLEIFVNFFLSPTYPDFSPGIGFFSWDVISQ